MAVGAKISTVIIGCEADLRSRTRMPREEAAMQIRRLKEYANLSYESEATIATKIGVGEKALNGWLCGKSTPTFKSLLKVREFVKCQPKIVEGIAPVGYLPVSRQ